MEDDDRPPLHVAFGPSAAESVRRAMHRSGFPGQVIGFMDNLSFGPIEPAASRSRSAWIVEQLGDVWHKVWHETCRNAEAFWAEVTSPTAPPIAWVCRNNAFEFSGFLEFVWRMGDRPFRVIDASHLLLPCGTKLWSLGGLKPSQIIEAGLLARQTILSSTERDRLRDMWRELKDENAPFRVVDARGLASTRIDHFDNAILASTAPEWRVGARVVGDAMSELIERPFAQCPGDVVIWSRVLALNGAGLIELKGSRSAMRDCQVRRMP